MVVHAFADVARSPVAPLAEDPDADLYRELLGRLPELVANPDRVKDLWEDEDRALTDSEAAIASGVVQVSEQPEVDLAIVDFADPDQHWTGHRFSHRAFEDIHPMAVNNATDRFALLVVRGRRYRFTYRYDTRVQYRSRRPKARVDLAPLADELTAAEPGSVRWFADPPGELARLPVEHPARQPGRIHLERPGLSWAGRKYPGRGRHMAILRVDGAGAGHKQPTGGELGAGA